MIQGGKAQPRGREDGKDKQQLLSGVRVPACICVALEGSAFETLDPKTRCPRIIAST
jgi:hypothetical protein